MLATSARPRPCRRAPSRPPAELSTVSASPSFLAVDLRRQLERELALRALDVDVAPADGHGDALRHGHRALADARLALRALSSLRLAITTPHRGARHRPCGGALLVGHQAVRRAQDRDAEARSGRAGSGRGARRRGDRDARRAGCRGTRARAIATVLEHDRERPVLLRAPLLFAHVGDVAFGLEDLRDASS